MSGTCGTTTCETQHTSQKLNRVLPKKKNLF